MRDAKHEEVRTAIWKQPAVKSPPTAARVIPTQVALKSANEIFAFHER